MSEPLHIPVAATVAGYDLVSTGRGHYVPGAARRVATPVVAAELRAQADSFHARIGLDSLLPEPHTLAVVVAQLRARADDLDPPKGGAR